MQERKRKAEGTLEREASLEAAFPDSIDKEKKKKKKKKERKEQED